MNKTILIGRVATDPEHAIVGNDIPRCAFRLAVRRKYKNEQGGYDADFLTIVCWRGLADIVARSVKKGAMCGVVGAIMTRDYTDNKGVKRYITEIVADEVEFLSPKDAEANAGPSEGYSAMQGEQQKANFTEVEDDELPF